MIRLEHITKHYGETLAVNDFSLEVSDGNLCILIGPSGCGKTTLLRIINRLIEPTSGHVFIDGTDTSQAKPEELRRSIGYVIQSVGLFPHMTVAANIAVVPELLHWPKDRSAKRTEELLTLVGMDPAEYSQKYPRELSGGEAQRIGVARALAADPPIMLMDEPFGAVDPLTRQRLQAQFASIQQELKKTVIMVTHDLDEAIRLADRIAIMESGKLVQYDTPEVILSKPANKFVHDFVGADRALKRLSRISIKSIIKLSPPVPLIASLEQARSIIGSHRSAWVVDEDNRLLGWLDRDNLSTSASVGEATVRGEASKIAVAETATMKEALSRILEQGFKFMPVVDENKHYVGEVELRDIEAATMGTEE